MGDPAPPAPLSPIDLLRGEAQALVDAAPPSTEYGLGTDGLRTQAADDAWRALVAARQTPPAEV